MLRHGLTAAAAMRGKEREEEEEVEAEEEEVGCGAPLVAGTVAVAPGVESMREEAERGNGSRWGYERKLLCLCPET
jgi:hypothetical protein